MFNAVTVRESNALQYTVQQFRMAICVQAIAEGRDNHGDGRAVVDYREFDPERRALLDAEAPDVAPFYAPNAFPFVQADDSLALARDKCAPPHLSVITVISRNAQENARAAMFTQAAVRVTARRGRLRAGGAGHGDRPAHAARPQHHCRRQTPQTCAPALHNHNHMYSY